MGKNPGVPPGTINTTSKQLINSCKVVFPSQQLYNITLPPINRVGYTKDNAAIGVSTFFLVDATLVQDHINDLQFEVYQLYCINDAGEPQLQCYITSNYTNGKTDEYCSVQVDFDITAETMEGTGIGVEDITSVQTFLWNIDPRTSRGTVTTVLTATG